MKPSQIHALPDQLVEPWYRSPGNILEDVFGLSDHMLDLTRAEEEGKRVLHVHKKLSGPADSENWVTVSSLVFRGEPFAIHTQAGAGDNNAVRITDWQVHSLARAFVEGWRLAPPLYHIDATKDEDDTGITDLLGLVAMEINGRVDLVNRDCLSEDGTLVMDPDAYEAAFDRLLRKGTQGRNETGFADPEIRALAAQVIAEAIPSGLDKVIVDGFDEKGDWIGVVVATGEGSYRIGIGRHCTQAKWLSWGSGMVTARIGGPEEIEAFREGTAPKP